MHTERNGFVTLSWCVKFSCCPLFVAILVGTFVGHTSWTRSIDPIGDSEPIAEIMEVSINGWRHAVLIRGADRRKPLLIQLHGGPGIGNLYATDSTKLLEKHFLTVKYDQRGAGKSCHFFTEKLNGTLTRDQLVQDTVEMTKWLLNKFGKKKAFLCGGSWGASLAVLTAYQRPDLFYALSVRGLPVLQGESDSRGTDLVLERLRNMGNMAEYEKLVAMTKPKITNVEGLEYQRGLMNKLGMMNTPCRYKRCTRFSLVWDLVKKIVKAPAYNWQDFISFYWCTKRSLALLFFDLYDMSFFETVPKLEIPILAVHGRYDFVCQLDYVEEYVTKQLGGELVVLEDQAHSFDEDGTVAYQRRVFTFFSKHSPEKD